jgi:hypothetical protein
MKKTRCQLKVGPHYQCCCHCKKQIKDHSHPGTDGKSILHIRGYICLLPPVTSGWSKHSIGCEMYDAKKRLLKSKIL